MSKSTYAANPPVATETGIKTTDSDEVRQQTPPEDCWSQTPPEVVHGILPPTDAAAWSPRVTASHLLRGPNGIWYMRLVVPARIRALHPELPKELKRSTKVGVKSIALAKAREMCLDFSIKYSSGAAIRALDKKHDQSFALYYENRNLRIDHSSSANAETLFLMKRCFDHFVMQAISRVVRPANDELVSPAQFNGLISGPVIAPSPPPVAKSESVHRASEQTVGPWLSDAIEDWLENGGAKFSDLSWQHSYEPTFRVFRELIGDVRRDRTAKDGALEHGILDIQLHRLTRSHIESFYDGLKCLPANQGRSTKETEAHERIRQGVKDKAKFPSLSSVDKKLGHVAPFISYAGLKNWVALEVVSEMTLATQSAKANLVKASKNSTRKKGAIALSDFELKKMFQQAAFLDGAMNAA